MIDKLTLQTAGLIGFLGLVAMLSVSADNDIRRAMSITGATYQGVMQRYDTDRNGILNDSEFKNILREYNLPQKF